MLLGIVRHAKAEKDAPSGRDEDRPLMERGLMQAEFLAGRFALHHPRPDAIITSRAVRARQTAARIARACGVDFDFDDRLLVDRPLSPCLDLVAERVARADRRFLLLVGHNDQVSLLTASLIRRAGPLVSLGVQAAPDQRVHELRTGEAVLLTPKSPDAGPGAWRLVDIWRMPD